jgi:hypothetical protein
MFSHIDIESPALNGDIIWQPPSKQSCLTK